MRAGKFKTRICVNFNKPNFEVFINHEIIPKKFKSMVMPLWIYLFVDSLYCISSHCFHLRDDLLFQLETLLRKIHIKVSLKFHIRHFVSLFKLSIVLRMLLNCVISQMDQFICHILEGELFR